MYDLLDVHSTSKQHREEILHEARMRHLERRLRENRRGNPERSRIVLAWRGALASLLRGTRLASQTGGQSEEQR
jgi:hypothetical protein